MKAVVGDVILSCSPYAHVLMGKDRGSRCDECFKEGSLRERTLNRCSKCRIAHYCSPKCQRSAWLFHKAECDGFLRTKPEIPSESVRLLARLILRYERKDHLKRETFAGLPGIRGFDDLVSHVEDLLSDPLKSQHFVTAWETVRMFLGTHFVDALFPGDPRNVSAVDAVSTLTSAASSHDDDDNDDTNQMASSILIGAAIFGRMSVNSFSILDQELRPIGVGVYLPASKLDHACDGNVTPSFDGVRLVLRAREDLPELSFEDLSLCYVDPLAPTWERKENLFSQYFFNCRCSWCAVDKKDIDDKTDQVDDRCEGNVDFLLALPNDSRLPAVPFSSSRDAKMLSVKCPCAAGGTSCPKTQRACGGVMELTRRSNDDPVATASSASSPMRVRLSPKYDLNLSLAAFSPCDVCLCPTNEETREKSMSTFGDLVDASRDALAEIEAMRKEDAKKRKNEDDAKRHFEDILGKCQKLLERQTMFSAFNIFLLRTLDHAFDVCIHLGKWKEALFYGQKTIAPFRLYHTHPHPMVALQLFKVAKLSAYLEPPSRAVLGLLSDAVEMLYLSHGSSDDATGCVTSEAKDLLTQLQEEMRANEAFQGLTIEDRNRIPFYIKS